jgi:hypothetical protein
LRILSNQGIEGGGKLGEIIYWEMKMLATPTSSLGLNGKIGEYCEKTAERVQETRTRKSGARIGSSLKWEKQITPFLILKRLNPIFVEWMMGWPTNWTDLKPLAMDKFRQWLEQFGRYLTPPKGDKE